MRSSLSLMLTRKQFLIGAAAAGLVPGLKASARPGTPLTLKSGLALPPIGMGTWQTFDIPSTGAQFENGRHVLDAFFEMGGSMIDSSPMYGRAEAAIGALLTEADRNTAFSATKIWTAFEGGGPTQLADSERLWREPQLDLVYVHNLLRWEAHLKTLKDAREKGRVRYIGLTTSHGRRHDKLEELMASEPIDAVQFSYNIANRAAEKRLLPAAADNGLAVIINRPFMTGYLFNRVRGHKLPDWAIEYGIESWAAFFLKFVMSHPAVTCVIPATRQVEHMRENMRALNGPLPDQGMREKMVAHFDRITS